MSTTTYRTRLLAAYRAEREKGHTAQSAWWSAPHDAMYGPGSKKLRVLESQYAAYDGEEITELPNGWKLKIEFQHDENSGPPWENDDGCGVVTDWGPQQENMEDWVLHADRHSYRYYDWKASLQKAMEDGWDSPPYRTGTPRERAMRAIKSNYEYLRRWCNDDWWYVGTIVTLYDKDDEDGERGAVLAEDSCWGHESDSIDYLCSEARSWAARMIREARDEKRAEILREKIDNRFADAMEDAL